jgi:hypothetical protein
MPKYQPTQEQVDSLTKKEHKYWLFMRSGNVPFLKGKPGTAKSAIGESIAKKLGFQYIDLRLSTMDNTDLSLPIASRDNGIAIHEMTVPHWAILANAKPTIIHAEEINRCSRSVQNAMLGIIRERRVGSNFRFNENVYLMSSGNLGEEDGNDVEEFSSALNNRFVHVQHQFTISDWYEGYAREHVIPSIINFVNAKSEHFCPPIKEGSPAFASPRSWSMLSEYLIDRVGRQSTYKEQLEIVKEDAASFVGVSAAIFMKWLDDNSTLTLKDLFERYPEIKREIKDSRIAEFFVQLKEADLRTLNEKQIKNLRLFLEDVSDKKLDDQIAAYFNDTVITTKGGLTLNDLMKLSGKSEEHKLFFMKFKRYFTKIRQTGVAS